jgi:hypothetical protein
MTSINFFKHTAFFFFSSLAAVGYGQKASPKAASSWLVGKTFIHSTAVAPADPELGGIPFVSFNNGTEASMNVGDIVYLMNYTLKKNRIELVEKHHVTNFKASFTLKPKSHLIDANGAKWVVKK